MDYFSFAFRNLRKRGLRSWLTLLGIFIGIVAVISLITLGNGLKEAVNAQFGTSSTQLITVQAGGLSYGPPGSGVVEPLTKKDAEAIEKLSSVNFAIPRHIRSGKLEYNDIVNFGYATSIPDDKTDEMYKIIGLEVEEGKLLKQGDSKKVLLGYSFLDGDTNGFEKEIIPGKKILLNDEKFEVAGILKRQGSFLLDGVVWVLDSDLNDLLNYGDDVDIIAVEVKSKDLMDRAKEDIEKLLRKRRNVKVGEEDFEVSTPESSLEQVNSILNAIQIFIIIIASISIVIGAIGIVNTMTTSVLERKKEIGIMKAIGARNKHIFFQFFVESGLLGLVGGIAGIIVGLLVGYAGVSALNSFLGGDCCIDINIPLIVFSLIGSFAIGAAAGIIPALRAANQSPVEALRG